MIDLVVALVKAEKNIKHSLEMGIELINGFQDLKSPVIIKPNICTINDKTGFAVNDVRVVEALLDLLFKEETIAKTFAPDSWHNELNRFIVKHKTIEILD